jgi:L-alanine-DL-glutamate epimerase-like enolase superfamily enzyme
MIIANIEAFPLRIPFKSIGAAASAWGDKAFPVSDSVLVRVSTVGRVEGSGETFGFRAVSRAKLAIEELIAPLQRPGRNGDWRIDAGGAEELHIFGRWRPLFYGGAPRDRVGKVTGAPVYPLLGGSGTELPCYASLIRPVFIGSKA